MAEETPDTGQGDAPETPGVDKAAFAAEVKKVASRRSASKKSKQPPPVEEPEPELEPAATVDDDGGTDEPPPEKEQVDWQPTKRQVDAAKQLGLSDDVIAELSEGAMAALDDASVTYSRKMSELGRKMQQASKAPAPKAELDDSGDGDDEPFVARQFGDLDWGEESGTQQITAHGQQIEKLVGQVNELLEAYQFDRDEKVRTSISGYFKDSVPTALREKYGAEEASVSPDSAEGKARDELVRKSAEIQIGYRIANDGKQLPVEDALDQAMKIIDSDTLQGAAADRKADAIRKRSDQRVPAGSGRSNDADHGGLTKKDKAVAAITQAARKRGIHVPS